MNNGERRAIEELRFDYTPVAEDIWQPLPFHVDGLQPSAEQSLIGALGDAERSAGPSPLGVVLQGQRGAGKTHLLGWLRQQVHVSVGYFFLVSLLDAGSFWTSVLQSIKEGLNRPWGGEHTQAQVLLFRLGEEVGAPDELLSVLIGTSPVTPEALDHFDRLLVARDRQTARRSRAVARALVLFASDDFEHQEIAETYLQSEEDEYDLRRSWGLPTRPRLPEELVAELTALMALTGPTVIAVDQVDTLISQSVRGLGADQADAPGAPRLLLLEQIGGGLMGLKDKTRRTLTVLACLPSSWENIKANATDTVQDRFRETTQLRTIPSPELARKLVSTRFAAHFDQIGFTPEYDTWPVAPEAFGHAVSYTPRQLFREIDHHLRRCEVDDEVRVLHGFGGEGTDVPPPPSPPDGEVLATFDRRYEQLAAEAEIDGLLGNKGEDGAWPGLLASALWAWVMERGDDRGSYLVDPPPGRGPALHARLRRILDEETEDQLIWSFRAIAGDHHFRAALSRLQKACTAAALSTELAGRYLVVLRDGPWNSGPKTTEAVGEFRSSGGFEVAPTDADLRRVVAIDRMRAENAKHLDDWLESRQPMTHLELLATLRTEEAIGGPVPDEPPGGAGPPSAEPSEAAGPSEAAEPAGPTGADDTEGGGTLPPEAPASPQRPSTGSSGAPRPSSPPTSRRGLADGPTGEVSVPVGTDIDSGGLMTVPLATLRKHVAIFAGSGSGKTVLIRRLVEECALRGVSAIVLDPNNDLARLGDSWPKPPPAWTDGDEAKAERYLATTEVVVWTPGRESGRPLTFQPLPDFFAVRHDVDEFNEAVSVAVAALEPRVLIEGKSEKAELRRAVLRRAVEHFGRSGGGSLKDLASILGRLPFGVSELADAKKIAANLGQMLTAAMVNDPLLGGTGTPMDPGMLLTPSSDKLARISVISFVGLPGDEQRQAFVNQLQMSLFAWVRNHPAGDRPLGGLLVMDEAQNFAPSGAMTASTQSTLAIAAQFRKYGVGLVFATQAPKGLHNRIAGNATTQFFGKLNAPAQVGAAKEMAAAKGGDVSDVSRLGVGQFYGSFESGAFTRLRTPLCLSHHPPSPLTTEEVLERARRSDQDAGYEVD